MEINTDHEIIKVSAAMKLYRAQFAPGKLTLYRDKINFTADGMLKGMEIKDTFYLKELKSVKAGRALLSYRIVIMDHEGETWLFNQVSKKEGQKFVAAYNEIKQRF